MTIKVHPVTVTLEVTCSRRLTNKEYKHLRDELKARFRLDIAPHVLYDQGSGRGTGPRFMLVTVPAHKGSLEEIQSSMQQIITGILQK